MNTDLSSALRFISDPTALKSLNKFANSSKANQGNLFPASSLKSLNAGNSYFGNGNAYGQGNGLALFGQLFQMMGLMLQMMSLLGNAGGGYNPPVGYDDDYAVPPPAYEPPADDYEEPPVDDYEPPTYEPPVYEPPVYEPPTYEPPVYEPPVEEPPVYEPPVDPPTYPPEEKEKIKGSAGLFGDPKFGLFSPGAPAALREFESGIRNGQTVTLLNDADKGGFKIEATGIQVNPADSKSTGIGSAVFSIGNGIQLRIANNGDIIKQDGDALQVLGNVKNSGLMSEIDLGNGVKVSTALRVDDAQGNKKERIVIKNGEYEVTMALRSPHPDAKNYFDMNFEELTLDAADNATGYQATLGSKKFGIADLLRLEPDALNLFA